MSDMDALAWIAEMQAHATELLPALGRAAQAERDLASLTDIMLGGVAEHGADLARVVIANAERLRSAARQRRTWEAIDAALMLGFAYGRLSGISGAAVDFTLGYGGEWRLKRLGDCSAGGMARAREMARERPSDEQLRAEVEAYQVGKRSRWHSIKHIAAQHDLSPSTVRDCVKRAEAALRQIG